MLLNDDDVDVGLQLVVSILMFPFFVIGYVARLTKRFWLKDTDLPPGARGALLNSAISSLFRRSRFGRYVLLAHRWTWDAGLLVMTAPNGRTVKMIDIPGMSDIAVAKRYLDAGGTPLDIDKITSYRHSYASQQND